jgi:hypothetical protein
MGIPLGPRVNGREAAALRIAAIHLGQNRSVLLTPRRTRRQGMFRIALPADGGGDPLSAVPAALESLRSLVRDGIPKDRFDFIRTSLLNGGRLAAGGPGELLTESLDIPGGEDGADAVRRRAILADLTREDVDRSVRKYLDPGWVRIGVVAADAEAALRALAPAVSQANMRAVPAAEIFSPARDARK